MSCAISWAYSLSHPIETYARSCLFINHFFSTANWTEEW